MRTRPGATMRARAGSSCTSTTTATRSRTRTVRRPAGCRTRASSSSAPTADIPHLQQPQQPTSPQDATTAKLVEAVAQYLASQSAPKKDAALDEINKKALQKVIDQAKAELAGTKQVPKAALAAPLGHGVKAERAQPV